MIHLTRLNHIPFVVNSDLIEQIEMTPDTVITLTTGQKFMVLENADEVIHRVLEFRRSLLSGLPSQVGAYETHALHPHIPPASHERFGQEAGKSVHRSE